MRKKGPIIDGSMELTIKLIKGDFSVIKSAFVWRDTDEGFDYWRRVADRGYLTEEDKVSLLMQLPRMLWE